MVKEEEPLVSIIVITYNSSKYVLETLESAKAQTYQNIELIVSDDCSTDDTVEICQKWIENCGPRFVRTELITTDKNTGIAANCNRGLNVANGEWVKYIAGDDVLSHNCIELNVMFIKQEPNAYFVFSKSSIIETDRIIDRFVYSDFFSFSLNKQVKLILHSNQISATTAFINTNALKSLKGWDENYSMMEDYPMWVNALLSGFKIYGFNQVTCFYRIHDMNVSMSSTYIFNENHIRTLKRFIIRKLLKENLKRINVINFVYSLCFVLISEFILFNKNRNSGFNSLLLKIMEVFKKVTFRYYRSVYN